MNIISKTVIKEEAFLPEGNISVGITSGASTPDRVVEHVIQKLMKLSESKALIS